mgnify:CR=1 FL=1
MRTKEMAACYTLSLHDALPIYSDRFVLYAGGTCNSIQLPERMEHDF